MWDELHAWSHCEVNGVLCPQSFREWPRQRPRRESDSSDASPAAAGGEGSSDDDASRERQRTTACDARLLHEQRLGRWVANQRRSHKEGRLSEARTKKLETLPDWTWSRSTHKWRFMCHIVELMVNQARGQPGGVEASIEDCLGGNASLMRWVSKQRASRQCGKLLGWQVAAVEGISGWQWSVQVTWQEHRQELDTHLAENSGQLPANTTKLGRWVDKQRTAFRQRRRLFVKTTIGKWLSQAQFSSLALVPGFRMTRDMRMGSAQAWIQRQPQQKRAVEAIDIMARDAADLVRARKSFLADKASQARVAAEQARVLAQRPDDEDTSVVDFGMVKGRETYAQLLCQRPDYCKMMETLDFPSAAVQRFTAYLERVPHRRVADFGRHKGTAYGQIVFDDFEYCKWARNGKRNGPLLHFVWYLCRHVPETRPTPPDAEPTPCGRSWGPMSDLPLSVDYVEHSSHLFGVLESPPPGVVLHFALPQTSGAPKTIMDQIFVYGLFEGLSFRDVVASHPKLCEMLYHNKGNKHLVGQLRSFANALASLAVVRAGDGL
jgi:hypothetical protein